MSHHQALVVLLISAAILRFGLVRFLAEEYPFWVRLVVLSTILVIGSVYILRKTAGVIERTTSILSQRTQLAGGLLQSFGTAFPDMVLGVIAALVSLRLQSSNPARAINFAIIAAATTFGSNIYNIAHAAWCLWRQNRANQSDKPLLMFPRVPGGGTVRPMRMHLTRPHLQELDTAINVSLALTLLTGAVALSMVIFGQVPERIPGIEGDLYQLIRPVGFGLLFLSIYILYRFRTAQRKEQQAVRAAEEINPYQRASNKQIWLHLSLAGITILLIAESMVRAIEILCEVANVPFVVAGVLAGLIGCLGEMIVVHNFSVNPGGRIGDAVVGVAMDNIVTIVGASVVAIMGGIFLGSNALILIFVIILALNSLLIVQISQLKNSLLPSTSLQVEKNVL